MKRPLSKLAPDWWDYTTLDAKLLDEAARLDERKLKGLSRPGFKIHFYDTVEEFYTAEALEYVHAWLQSTPTTRLACAGRSAQPNNCPWWPAS